MKKKRILLCVTASIAAYRSCDIINNLRKSGFEVQVLMSPDAHHFITPLTLQTLSGKKVVCDMFELPQEWDIRHVSLAEWADIVLIAPASADMISRLACGLANCVVSATVLATQATVIIAPAMNDRMYAHRTIQDNLARLRDLGYLIVGPRKGRLACGYEAMGHIAGTDEIVRLVKENLHRQR